MHFQFGETPAQAHPLAETERQGGESVMLVRRPFNPTLWAEFRGVGKVLFGVTHHVVLEDDLSLKINRCISLVSDNIR